MPIQSNKRELELARILQILAGSFSALADGLADGSIELVSGGISWTEERDPLSICRTPALAGPTKYIVESNLVCKEIA